MQGVWRGMYLSAWAAAQSVQGLWRGRHVAKMITGCGQHNGCKECTLPNTYLPCSPFIFLYYSVGSFFDRLHVHIDSSNHTPMWDFTIDLARRYINHHPFNCYISHLQLGPVILSRFVSRLGSRTSRIKSWERLAIVRLRVACHWSDQIMLYPHLEFRGFPTS